MTYRRYGILPLAAATALLVGAAPALAQQQEHHPAPAPHPAARPAPAPHPMAHPMARPAPHPMAHAMARPAPHPMAHAMARPAPPPGESHPGPTAYQRVNAPPAALQRPQTFNRAAYQHNFQAARSYSIGPYHPPRGYVARRWAYGQILPRAFWVSQYVVADYWLFSLEVPPIGYQWVRYGPDALLVDTTTGEILQVEYGVFA
jgi:Ni/Co efflux regulator RcnB